MNKILYTLILILLTMVSNAQKSLLTLNDTTMISRDESPAGADVTLFGLK